MAEAVINDRDPAYDKKTARQKEKRPYIATKTDKQEKKTLYVHVRSGEGRKEGVISDKATEEV